MIERCPFCKADVKPHCKSGHRTCRWTVCPECGVTIDAESMRAYDKRAKQVKWPYARPE